MVRDERLFDEWGCFSKYVYIYIYIYINIIYTPNLGPGIAVPVRKREQGRWRNNIVAKSVSRGIDFKILVHLSNIRRVLDPTESVFCFGRSRAMAGCRNRRMKDVESLYLYILTNINHQFCPCVDMGRCCGICQSGFALGPWWGGLNAEDPIEQRTISNGARAQRSRGHLNNTPNSGLDDGPTGVVLVRIDITQLRNAVDGDNGGAIGCQPARFPKSFDIASFSRKESE